MCLHADNLPYNSPIYEHGNRTIEDEADDEVREAIAMDGKKACNWCSNVHRVRVVATSASFTCVFKVWLVL
jgi:hypothetical protein